jgi:hypothetical protein
MLVAFRSHHFFGRHVKRHGQLCLGHVTIYISKAADELPNQILMKNNPLYINDSNVLNDSSTTTQIQFHCLSRLLVVCVLKQLKNESFIESFISVFHLVACMRPLRRTRVHVDAAIYPWDNFITDATVRLCHRRPSSHRPRPSAWQPWPIPQ